MRAPDKKFKPDIKDEFKPDEISSSQGGQISTEKRHKESRLKQEKARKKQEKSKKKQEKARKSRKKIKQNKARKSKVKQGKARKIKNFNQDIELNSRLYELATTYCPN